MDDTKMGLAGGSTSSPAALIMFSLLYSVPHLRPLIQLPHQGSPLYSSEFRKNAADRPPAAQLGKIINRSRKVRTA